MFLLLFLKILPKDHDQDGIQSGGITVGSIAVYKNLQSRSRG